MISFLESIPTSKMVKQKKDQGLSQGILCRREEIILSNDGVRLLQTERDEGPKFLCYKIRKIRIVFSPSYSATRQGGVYQSHHKISQRTLRQEILEDDTQGICT